MGTLNPGGRAITAAMRLLGTELQCVPLLGVGEQMAGEQEARHSCVPRAREYMHSPAAPSLSTPQAGEQLCQLFLGFCWSHMPEPVPFQERSTSRMGQDATEMTGVNVTCVC